MELAFNLVWLLLAAILLSAWLRSCPRARAGRRMEFVALAVLILLLFPVVSVTDDLQAALNPAEIDCTLRRGPTGVNAHPVYLSVAALPPPIFTGISLAVTKIEGLGRHPVPFVELPALTSIQNRPPPSA